MNNMYPFSLTGTLVLTEQMYEDYGGWTGSSTLAARQLAFWSAERQVSEHLNTFLVEGSVTGVYSYPSSLMGNRLKLGHSFLKKITSLRYIGQEYQYYVSGSELPNSLIADYTYGLLNAYLVDAALSGYCKSCATSAYVDAPINLEVVYTTGLPAETPYEPSFLMALVMAAELNLKELADPGALEGGRGDAGVQSFRNMDYSEDRTKLQQVLFGGSATANKIRKLLLSYRRRTPVGF